MNDYLYKYDVAFSFLAQDESLATELNDLLQDRFSTFLYSKKQGEIAGTDGEKTFNTVFGEDARLVVVLYRVGWGQTAWTRIEETAIRNRAYDHGYDFVKFIPLDEPQEVPKWLPRAQIWLGLKRWGVAGAASVIEARIEELGGNPHEETAEDRAIRLERSLKFDEERKRFLRSEDGVCAANSELNSLSIELNRLVVSIRSATTSISLQVKISGRLIVIVGLGPGLSIFWHYHYSNSLDDAHLEVTLWDSHPPFDRIINIEEPKKLNSMQFTFDLLPSRQCTWVFSNLHDRVFSTVELASFILKYYMDQTAAIKILSKDDFFF
jgi:hypothetical protein